MIGPQPVKVPVLPSCVILPDPQDDQRKCNAPCESGYTVLDKPVCDDCWSAIRLEEA